MPGGKAAGLELYRKPVGSMGTEGQCFCGSEGMPHAALKPSIFDTLPLLEPLITIIGIAVTALLVIWQIRKQFDHSLRLQWQQSKDKLKIDLYDQLGGHITDAATAEVESAGYARTLNLSIVGYWAVRNQGFEPSHIRERAPEFAAKKNELVEKVLKLIIALEDYDVVTPHLRIFRVALTSALHDIHKTFLDLYQVLSARLPIDLPSERTGEQREVVTVWPTPITEQHMSSDIEPLIDGYVEACSILQNYLYDLGVEAQVQYLGDLFEAKPKRREPIDPKYVVVTSDPDDLNRLESYFNNKTYWGQAKSEAETYARARVTGSPRVTVPPG